VIDARLLEIVACPNCRSTLAPAPDVALITELRCTNEECLLRYPIRDGVPVLLVDEASGGQGDSAAGHDEDASDDGAERAD
jgi:uncharacterized protein YbaR (Trm112 family)